MSQHSTSNIKQLETEQVDISSRYFKYQLLISTRVCIYWVLRLLVFGFFLSLSLYK